MRMFHPLFILPLLAISTVSYGAKETVSELCRLARIRIANLPILATQETTASLKLERKDFDTTVATVLLNSPGSSVGGQANDGVYSAKLADKSNVVIKLARRNQVSHGNKDDLNNSVIFNEYLSVHKLLSDLGYAVPLRGWIERSPLVKAVGKSDVVDTSKNVGLVMDRLPDPWNLSRERAKPWFGKWPAKHLIKIIKRMEEIENELNRMRIYSPTSDVQYFVYEENGEPHVVLGDLDSLRLYSGDSFPQLDMTMERRMIIANWMTMTGKPVPKSLAW